MKKLYSNNIGFTILAGFILIAPLLNNPAHSLNSLPASSNFPRTSIQSTLPSSLIGTNLLDTLNSNSSNDIDIELDDNGNNNDILESLLELDEPVDPVNPRDDTTRENLRELLGGSITNRLLANEITGNVEAVEEGKDLGDLSIARNLQVKKFNELESLELATTAEAVITDLNGIFSKCDNTKYDMAVHTIKGKANLNQILENVRSNDDISIELIVDNKPTETSLVLVGSPSVFLKGLISTDPYDSDPKEYDYDISHINTDCIAKTLTDKTLEITSGIKEPLVIPVDERITGSTAQFFQACSPVPPATGSADFAKYKLIGTSKEIQYQDLSVNGKVDLTVKIFVDFKTSIIPSKDPATVKDDNRIVAVQLIANEGKDGEKKFEFIPKDALTECNTVTFLQQPQNIVDNEVFGDPLYGFGKKKG